MIFPIGQEGRIYRERDESDRVEIGSFKMLSIRSKPERPKLRIHGDKWVTRPSGPSPKYITVEGCVNTTISVGEKVLLITIPTEEIKLVYQCWGTLTEYFPTTDGSNTFTGQIAVERSEISAGLT